jgi:hypothetical protein
MKRLPGLITAASLILTIGAEQGYAIPRSEVLVRAKSFAGHPWRATSSNSTASCSSSYKSVYSPGDYVGLPYDWGGYMTLFEFDQQIAKGYGAGSYPDDGVLSCTAGLDCSGYVSKCWAAGHYSTSTMYKTSAEITPAEVLPGDIYNQAGYHVALFSNTLASGFPVLYESAGYNVHVNTTGGWSYLSGYTPRRYNKIEGTTVVDKEGTPQKPIKIASFPYSDARDTTQSTSDVLDGCAAAASKKESGHEFIYQVTFTEPGQLTVSVADDVGVDIDVHLYTALNTSNCVSRHDSSFTEAVDCGTYYIVADTFGSESKQYPGAFVLSADFVATPNKTCGSGPAGYQPLGGLGEPCAYPSDETLPFCNDNLGATTCVYTSGANSISFCSTSCKTDSDCGAIANGCCEPLSGGDTYCVVSSLCKNPPTTYDSGVFQSADGGAQGELDAGGPVLDAEPGPAIDGDAATDPDTATNDAGLPVTTDAGTPSAGEPPPEEEGGCAVSGGPSVMNSFPLFYVLLFCCWAVFRRNHRRNHC